MPPQAPQQGNFCESDYGKVNICFYTSIEVLLDDLGSTQDLQWRTL